MNGSSRRMARAERRQHLLKVALDVLRAEGADLLTLGRLAERAGVSKPVAYDHFGTRSGLLIELYRAIDLQHADALRAALASRPRNATETVELLASAYVHCSVDTTGDWHAVAAALAGNAQREAVLAELLEGYVQLFASALAPHASLPHEVLVRRCVGLVGAGEALTAAMVAGRYDEQEAAGSLAALLAGAIASGPDPHLPIQPVLTSEAAGGRGT